MSVPGASALGRLRERALAHPVRTQLAVTAVTATVIAVVSVVTGEVPYPAALLGILAGGTLLGPGQGLLSGALLVVVDVALVVGFGDGALHDVWTPVGLATVAAFLVSGAVAGQLSALDLRWRRELDAREAAERALVERELTLSRLVEELPAAVWATDGELRLTVVKGRALEDLGYHVEDLVGGRLADLVGADADVLQSHRAALSGLANATELQLAGRTFETHVVPLHDARGKVNGSLGVGIDVTDRARIQEALASTLERERELIEQLRDVDEMKNSFIQAVSHELRTPLTALRGFATTVQRNGDRLSRDQRDLLLDRISVNADKLHRLLTDLLDVDRLSRGIVAPRRQRTDLAELVLRILDETDVGDRPLHTRVQSVVAHVDGPKVERIVENLISNAMKHTPRGTPLTVSVEAVPGGVGLCVMQAGVPVPDHLKTEIFQPFRQGPLRNAHTPGTGIGLALVTRFAELHGGSAWVEDTPDGGAAFCVFLPDHPAELEGIEVHDASERRRGLDRPAVR